MEFCRTQRGRKKLLYRGFAYVVGRRCEDKTIWRCEKRGERCPGRIHISKSGKILHVVDHPGHGPEPAKMQAKKVLEAIKEAAITSSGSAKQILSSKLSGVSDKVTAIMPLYSSLERKIRHLRQKKESEKNMSGRKKTVEPEISHSIPAKI